MTDRVIRNFVSADGSLIDTQGQSYSRNIGGGWVEDLSSIFNFEDLKYGAAGLVIGAAAVQIFGGVQIFGSSIPKDRTTTLLGALIGGVVGYSARGVIDDLTSVSPLDWLLGLPGRFFSWVWGGIESFVDWLVDKLKFW